MAIRALGVGVRIVGTASTVNKLVQMVHSSHAVSGTSNYPGHIPLNSAQNAFLALGSGVVGVLDTSRGGEDLLTTACHKSLCDACIDLIATLSETTASTFLPSLHSSLISTSEGRQIMRDRPNITSDSLSSLKKLRRGTLGREYVEWLNRGDVTPDTRDPVYSFYRFTDTQLSRSDLLLIGTIY